MVQYKKQLDAVMRCLTAETEEDRKNAQQEIRELLDGAERTAGKQDAETLVRDILVDIGVPEHLVGHPYLVAAICAAVEVGTYLKNITSDLYPTVAMTYGTTPSRAERAIREIHADMLFFSCRGLGLDGRLSDSALDETSIRQVMLEHSRLHYGLCDSSKLGKDYLHTLCRAQDLTALFCDKSVHFPAE